jgi:ketosteroid isomerase-like protein
MASWVERRKQMETIELVKTVYTSFERGDIPGATSVMDEAIEWSEAEGNPYSPTGAPFVGPDAVVSELFARLATEWDGFAVHPEVFHDVGDTVVVEGRYRGRHVGTGQALDAQFCHVWGQVSGRLIRFQQYTDTAQLQGTMASR